MQADFDLMRHAIEEAHPGLCRYATKAQMDREFDAQRGMRSRAMTDRAPVTHGSFEGVKR